MRLSSSSSFLFTIVATLLLQSVTVVLSSELYTLEWGPQVNNKFPFASIESSTNLGRKLQVKDSICSAVEERFKCVTESTIHENGDDGTSNSSYTVLTIETICDFGLENQFNFRTANNCVCEANVHRVLQDGTSPPDKVCPCAVCAEGFGDAPVAVDCSAWDLVANSTNTTNATTPVLDGINSTADGLNTTDGNTTTALESSEQPVIDSLVVSQCSSLDCGLSCNGTCRLDCAHSDSSCEFCSNNPANVLNGTGTNDTLANRTDDPLTNYDGKPIDDKAAASNAQSVQFGITFTIASIGMILALIM
jgi:hypothetical protein